MQPQVGKRLGAGASVSPNGVRGSSSPSSSALRRLSVRFGRAPLAPVEDDSWRELAEMFDDSEEAPAGGGAPEPGPSGEGWGPRAGSQQRRKGSCPRERGQSRGLAIKGLGYGPGLGGRRR